MCVSWVPGSVKLPEIVAVVSSASVLGVAMSVTLLGGTFWTVIVAPPVPEMPSSSVTVAVIVLTAEGMPAGGHVVEVAVRGAERGHPRGQAQGAVGGAVAQRITTVNNTMLKEFGLWICCSPRWR